MYRRSKASLIAVFAFVPASVVAQGSIAIRNVTVISMTDAKPSVSQTVIVRNGRIVEIGATARVDAAFNEEISMNSSRA